MSSCSAALFRKCSKAVIFWFSEALDLSLIHLRATAAISMTLPSWDVNFCQILRLLVHSSSCIYLYFSQMNVLSVLTCLPLSAAESHDAATTFLCCRNGTIQVASLCFLPDTVLGNQANRVPFLSHHTWRSFSSNGQGDLYHLAMSETLCQVFYQGVASF